MQPALATRIERVVPAPGGASTLGTEISISFRPFPFLPMRLNWVARIVEIDVGHYFVDEQREGPFTHFRHRHVFATEERDGTRGTVVGDEIEFELPFGVVGRLAAPLVRQQLSAAFAARQHRLPALLSAS